MNAVAAILLAIASLIGAAAAPRPSGETAAPAPQAIPPAPQASARSRVMAVAASQVGTQERSGRNDGEVVKYLRSVGLGAGQPYCAAFVFWCGREALGNANPFPRSAWSPDFVTRPTWTRARGGITPAAGDTFGIWHASRGRIAHTGFVAGISGRSIRTVEANTSPGTATGEADRNGDGVWAKIRPLSTVHSVQRWLP